MAAEYPQFSTGISFPPIGQGALGRPLDATLVAPVAGAGMVPAGLVSLETSGKFDPENPEYQRKRRLGRMRRAVTTAARTIQETITRGGFRWKPVMVTLTYRPGERWGSRHVSDFLGHVRKYLARRHDCALHHVWVSELQSRGAVHYHVLLWLPRGITLPKPDKQGWWAYGSTKIEWARSPAGYMAKYASKGSSAHELPKGLRLHGRGGLTASQRQIVRYWCLPRYVREHFQSEGQKDNALPDVVRMAGGGWIDRATGEWMPPFCLPPPPGTLAARRLSA